MRNPCFGIIVPGLLLSSAFSADTIRLHGRVVSQDDRAPLAGVTIQVARNG